MADARHRLSVAFAFVFVKFPPCAGGLALYTPGMKLDALVADAIDVPN